MKQDTYGTNTDFSCWFSHRLIWKSLQGEARASPPPNTCRRTVLICFTTTQNLRERMDFNEGSSRVLYKGCTLRNAQGIDKLTLPDKHHYLKWATQRCMVSEFEHIWKYFLQCLKHVGVSLMKLLMQLHATCQNLNTTIVSRSLVLKKEIHVHILWQQVKFQENKRKGNGSAMPWDNGITYPFDLWVTNLLAIFVDIHLCKRRHYPPLCFASKISFHKWAKEHPQVFVLFFSV